MARYFAELSYYGTNFNGWQTQPNAPSVQSETERAISVLLRTPTSIVGAGRTDTGVHAKYYIAHFDYCGIKEVTSKDFVYHLNSVLSRDIVVHSITQVADDAHVRFDAVSREYKYFVSTLKDPFNRKTAAQIYGSFDVQRMNEAAALLTEYDDFTSFAKLHTDVKTNLCRVTFAEWQKEGDTLIFTIRANRFLRNMVRSIVGTLLDVGRGKINIEDFRKIIELKSRCKAGVSAPAEGLYLTDVEYPYFKKK